MRKIGLLVCFLLWGMTVGAAGEQFRDIPENHWAKDAVYQLVRMGVISGFPDGTFRGSRYLNRYETSAILAKFARLMQQVRSEGVTTEEVRVIVQEELDRRDAKPNGVQVSGEVFARYRKGLQNESVTNNFDLDRTYLVFKRNMRDAARAEVTLDSRRVDTAGTAARVVFVKHAYVDLLDVLSPQWNFTATGHVRFGLQPTYWVDYMDEVLGSRYVVQSLTEIEGVLSPADFGLGAYGKVKFWEWPLISYHVTGLNGDGEGSVETNKGKHLAARVDMEVFTNLALVVGGQFSDVGGSGTVGKLANVALSYHDGPWAALVEGLYGAGQEGYSVGATYGIWPQVKLLARYDRYDPDRNTANDHHTRRVLGGEYAYSEDVRVSLNVRPTTFASREAQGLPNPISSGYLATRITF